MSTNNSELPPMALEAKLRADELMLTLDDGETLFEKPRVSSRPEGGLQHFPVTSLEGLSNYTLAWLLSYLNLQEVSQVSLASKRLHESCRTNSLWKLKFEDRWKIDERFRVVVTGQNWHKAYQEAYQNPHDLWIFHWNCGFPQDGLVPGRCCIYDFASEQSPRSTSIGKESHPHDRCPPCRFFPTHPLQYFINSKPKLKSLEKHRSDGQNKETPETIAEASDRSINDFCQHYGLSSAKSKLQGTGSYSIDAARRAFSQAGTFHRNIDTQQYTAASPHHESKNSTCMAQLKDLLFFNLTEEPLSTWEGAKELQHLKEERDRQQEWEQNLPFSREQRRTPQDFLKPAYQTSHHSWHQVVFTNPDFMRPLVFRISVARPDCFAVFPSEGLLNAGESKVITFGVRPLGSLVATAFETINAQRHDVEDWMKQLYNEEGTLPCQPFAVRYRFSSLAPCTTATGFIPPHRAQPRQEIPDNENDTEKVEDILWKNKQAIDYHWSGGNTTVSEAEIGCILLSAHVNGHYQFSKFRNHTLTPFELSIEPSMQIHRNLPMLYFAAPQLFEFYPDSVYPKLQEVHLETEVSHAGQVFRSHRRKCTSCKRKSWGARLEEMGQAFVLARLQDWLWERRQQYTIQNGLTIIKALADRRRLKEKKSSADSVNSPSTSTDGNERELIQSQRLIYVAQKMIARYRSAPYVNQEIRGILTCFEVVADSLYGINTQQMTPNTDLPLIPWKKAGIYRHATSTSIFHNDIGMNHLGADVYLKDDPDDMGAFRQFLHTPGSYNLGPQEDSNHPGELDVARNPLDDPLSRPASATDMFMDDPIQSFRCAIITLQDPRSVLVHGIYDSQPYPGKVVRRPRMPLWLRKASRESVEEAGIHSKSVFYHLQDALDLYNLLPPSSLDASRSFSLRRYLRNIPPLGMARFPICIDDGCTPEGPPHSKDDHSGEVSEQNSIGSGETGSVGIQDLKGRAAVDYDDVQSSPSYRVVELTLPTQCDMDGDKPLTSGDPSLALHRPDMTRSANQRLDENRDGAWAVPVVVNNPVGGGNLPPLLPGPGPRLLNLVWTISAQLGWNIDDGNHGVTSVYVKRELLIALQWLSLTSLAIPLFWTLVARAAGFVPCEPVDYLVDLPYQLTNEMRFLSESECGIAAFLLVMIWLLLGRYIERSTGRDFQRQMLDRVTPKKDRQETTFVERVKLRYERRWDEMCPIFLQRLSYTCSWNRRSIADLRNAVCSFRCKDGREHKSIFDASTGRGPSLSCVHSNNDSSQKLFFSAISALGSFTCSTPHFWINLMTVFSSSISLGLSMSVSSLEKGVSGGANMGRVLKSKLVMVTLCTLVGQLIGSSGGVLFLAELVVTSISFLLGGAGTISASSVESWGCFFCLSTAAFWGYLLSRVALMDGIILQKRHVRSCVFSTTLLWYSCVAVVLMWIWISFWRWDLPASLMIVRTGLGLAKTASDGNKVSAASGTVARSAAAEYASKNLQ